MLPGIDNTGSLARSITNQYQFAAGFARTEPVPRSPKRRAILRRCCEPCHQPQCPDHHWTVELQNRQRITRYLPVFRSTAIMFAITDEASWSVDTAITESIRRLSASAIRAQFIEQRLAYS